MYLIIRDSTTNTDVEVESLTGIVKGGVVDHESLGTPLSETSKAQPARDLDALHHFVLTSE